MPIYDIKSKSTGEIKEILLSYSKLQEFLVENPDWEHIITVPGYGISGEIDPIRWGRVKPPQEFKNLLTKMKKGNKGSTINDW